MTPRKPNPVMFERLESRAMMSAAPIASAPADSLPQSALHVELKKAVPAAQSLSRYVVGTWIDTIGRVFGVTMQYRQVWAANGDYLIQVNFRYGANGLPRQTAWTTLDYGTWRVVTASPVPHINGMMLARSHTGALSEVYVYADSYYLGDFGVRPAGSSARPDWVVFGRIV